MSHESEKSLSFTPSTNPWMRRCLLRRPDERLYPPFRPWERYLTGFSFNLRFLTVITSAYLVRIKLSSARNFSESPKKPLVVDAGEVDVTTIAAVEATISKTLFGRYWLAVIFESASSLQITLQSSASTNVGDYGAEGPVGGANVLRPSVTYGPLPSTYPSVTSSSFETGAFGDSYVP